MPELPEVETTRRGIAPLVEGQEVTEVIVRQPRLRTPVPGELAEWLVGQRFGTLARRAKYLLLPIADGHLLWHLGMSGSLRLVPIGTPPRTHDHVDVVLGNGHVLRYHDPRRFGFVDFVRGDPHADTRLARLGPEPLSDAFNGEHLFARSRKRRVAIKPFLMDNANVVGVGNIYASEALFMAGVDPRRPAGEVTSEECERLANAASSVLAAAIAQGGTTLRDFVGGDGKPGYFAQRLNVYGRGGEPCRECGHEIMSLVLGQRASCFCPYCQR
ncbi:bifunctional DNA-formamidopyrimidine glycosylase/DNA-(apurinic or apyrimidinic site) lyase [bacterium Scap17]|nr:bifunctional DNA-formamidopyrimidine glycosylase/DNA-(apurinic or apyrimidinic site) lyase [bacterium Scap17]